MLDELLLRKATIVITDREIDDLRVDSLYLGREFLGVAINNFNPLAQRASVTFADLAGMSFIVASDIGPWRTLIEQRIPGAQFLYQQDLGSLEQISRYSAFPFVYSNLTRSSHDVNGRFLVHTRTSVAIDDPAPYRFLRDLSDRQPPHRTADPAASGAALAPRIVNGTLRAATTAAGRRACSPTGT
ncbi:MAG: hypothetical protein U0N15_12210 [Bifidobacterium choerinum]